MSKWTPDSDELATRIARAKVVYEHHSDDVGMVEYLRRTNPRTEGEA